MFEIYFTGSLIGAFTGSLWIIRPGNEKFEENKKPQRINN